MASEQESCTTDLDMYLNYDTKIQNTGTKIN